MLTNMLKRGPETSVSNGPVVMRLLAHETGWVRHDETGWVRHDESILNDRHFAA
jgi:hypothetical protein